MRSHRSSSSSGLCWPKRRNSHWSVGNRIFDLDLSLISLCGSLPTSAQNAAMAALAHMPLRTMYTSIVATWNALNSAFLFFENGRPTSATRPASTAPSISSSGIAEPAPRSAASSFSLPASLEALFLAGILERENVPICTLQIRQIRRPRPRAGRAAGAHLAVCRGPAPDDRLASCYRRAGRAAERPSRAAPRPRPPGVYKQGNMFNH